MVLVAVGALVNSELLQPLGLATAAGIDVDAQGRTANPRVLAAGDCAYHMNRYAGRKLRLESVQNATDQARVAGASLAGRSVQYDAVPWFWSDQFNIKLQMVGFSEGADAHIVRGVPADGKFCVLHLREGLLVGMDAINAPAEYVTMKRLLPKQPRMTAEQAADLTFDLNLSVPV
jgi:3-phenylpropionate/trans-cinnamate dioxygenase ferredoxin reductase subunit